MTLIHNLNMLLKPSQSTELVEVFIREGKKHKYRKNDYIIRSGEPPPGVFLIERGLVKAYDITKYQEENLLIIRKDLELFPLIWAIAGKERNVVYQTLTETITYMISRKKFLDILNSNPNLLKPVLDMTIEMYRLHSERILNLEYRSVRERLVSFLITTGKRFGENISENEIDLNVPLRHQDIASSINATRETTSREISSLEKKGLIYKNGSTFVLKNLQNLKKIIE